MQRVDLKFRTKLISVNVWHDGSQCHPRFRPHWIPSLTAVQAIGLLYGDAERENVSQVTQIHTHITARPVAHSHATAHSAEMLRCPNPDEPCSTELAKLYLDGNACIPPFSLSLSLYALHVSRITLSPCNNRNSDRERYNELARQATITHAIEAYPPETLQRYATWFMPGVGPRLLIERIP